MIEKNLNDFVVDLKQRRSAFVQDPSPVVLLGAGASAESGIGTMTDLFKLAKCSNFEEFVDYIKSRNAAERYRLLSEFLQRREPPTEVTPGYRALATLIESKYFDIILSLNFDPLLDDALASARMRRRDYLLLINGIIRHEWLDLLLSSSSPRVKVIKLHGDLFHRCMAWTPSEMDKFVSDIMSQLKILLHNRDVLVVGTSLNDQSIRKLVLGTRGAIWYTHPRSVPDFLVKDDRVRAIVGPEGTFEKFFTKLARELGEETQLQQRKSMPVSKLRKSRITSSTVAQTIDDLLASVVAIASPDGHRICTGFILAKPRLIITDGFVGNTQFMGKHKVTIITSANRKFDARVISHVRSHPFGPLILQLPKGLDAPGLHLSTKPLKPRLKVHVGVAAGERIGISTGTVEDPKEKTLEITPIGKVNGLVAVDCAVAPGSSGAPVIDDQFAVRGFIVAGSDHPPSFMYPSHHWATFINKEE